MLKNMLKQSDLAEASSTRPWPIECMRRPIVNNSHPGEPIYDPFLGSGSEMTGRVCYGIKLNPDFVDVAVRRWQQFTGRAARH
jgi:DNA modification methylase